MIDQMTLAYVNLYAVLGALPELVRLDETARGIIKDKKPTRLGIQVKNGPAATLVFEDGMCHMAEGVEHTNIKLAFSSPEKFNGMINGTVTPIPRKGYARIFFLLKTFTKLTDRLTELLRTSADEQDEKTRRLSTELLLYVIGGACAQIGNHDPIGRFSASNIVDGDIVISIADGPAATLEVRGSALKAVNKKSENPRAIMEFESYALARALFDGKVNSVACIGQAQISMRGMISMIDNVNRILDRVALYLA